MVKPTPLKGVPGAPRQIPRYEIRKPAVVTQPNTYQQIKKGVNLIVDAIQPTLGPLPRLVAVENIKREYAPEFLDNGALIARRIIQIIPRGCDVGAMMVRNALWRMHQEVGDGSVTMGVIYRFLLNEGIRYVVQFDSNAMLLRSGFEKGLDKILDNLRQQAVPLAGREKIASFAMGMCQGDREMAAYLGEIFDMVGADGMIMVENWHRPGIDREYVEGTYWELSGWVSRLFLPDPADKRILFEDAAILISDLQLKNAEQVIPVLERCVKTGIQKLVIIAAEFADAVIGLLVNNNRAKTIETVAVRTPRVQPGPRAEAMQDIAILTGGKPFYSAAGESLESFQIEHLGFTRRAWATDSLFGIYGGKGDPRQIRRHLAGVRSMIKTAQLESEKETLQKRIGRLIGGTAILRLGGYTETEKTTRKETGLRAVNGIRHALRGGIVPGGGAALLNAQASLQSLQPINDDEAIAFRILARALEEPMRAIVQNAGYQPDVILEKVKSMPAGYGFDARTGTFVEMLPAGIGDALLVLEKALAVAVCGAALALTTDVIIHHKQPVESIEP